MEKPSRLVAVVYPQAGGFIARIFPLGIVCFSENLDGLRQEIKDALEKYAADMSELAAADAGYAVSAEEISWEEAEETSTVFVWDLDEMFPQ